MKKCIALTAALVSFSVAKCCAQIWYTGPGVVFDYDGVGNRKLREIRTICIGPSCPAGADVFPSYQLRPGTKDSTAQAAPDSARLQDVTASSTIVVAAYPNPVEQELFVFNRSWRNGDKATILVLDLTGKQLDRREITDAKESVPFRTYAPGTYMVHYLLNDVPTEIWRIIKM